MNWKPRPLEPLEQENNTLKTTIVCLRRELTDKEGHVGRLKFLLHERLTRIDDLNAKLEQARAQIRKLDGECEHLAEMVKAS
jgi:chromosome segregation ATPase